MILARRLASLLMCLTTLIGVGPLHSGQPVSTAAQEPGAKIWVGRQQEIEEYLRTAECVNMQMLGPNAPSDGVMRCELRPAGLLLAWPGDWPPRHLSRFLEELQSRDRRVRTGQTAEDGYAAARVERLFQGNKGSGTLWVENIVDSTSRVARRGKPGGLGEAVGTDDDVR